MDKLSLKLNEKLTNKDLLDQMKSIEINKDTAVQILVLTNVLKELKNRATAYLLENHGNWESIESGSLKVTKVQRHETQYEDDAELQALYDKLDRIKYQINIKQKDMRAAGRFKKVPSATYYRINLK